MVALLEIHAVSTIVDTKYTLHAYFLGLVILSEEFALRSKANPQSKDPCTLIRNSAISGSSPCDSSGEEVRSEAHEFARAAKAHRRGTASSLKVTIGCKIASA
jgi:hypothetical protein